MTDRFARCVQRFPDDGLQCIPLVCTSSSRFRYSRIRWSTSYQYDADRAHLESKQRLLLVFSASNPLDSSRTSPRKHFPRFRHPTIDTFSWNLLVAFQRPIQPVAFFRLLVSSALRIYRFLPYSLCV